MAPKTGRGISDKWDPFIVGVHCWNSVRVIHYDWEPIYVA